MSNDLDYSARTMNMLKAVYIDLYQDIFMQSDNDRFFTDYQKEMEEFFEEIKNRSDVDKAVKDLSKKVGSAIGNYKLKTPNSIQKSPKVNFVDLRKDYLEEWVLNGYFVMLKKGNIRYLIFPQLKTNLLNTIKYLCANINYINLYIFKNTIDLAVVAANSILELNITSKKSKDIIRLGKNINKSFKKVVDIGITMSFVSSISSTETTISPQSTIIFLLKQKIALAYDENDDLLVMDLLSPLLLETINSRKYRIREMSEQKDVMVIGPERETDKASDESSKCNNDNNKCKYKEDNIYMIDEDLAKERDAEIELMEKKMEAKRKKDKIIKQISKSFKKTIKDAPVDNISF